MTRTEPVCAVSSWSLHRAIGVSWWETPERPATREERWGPGDLAILDLPAALAEHGFHQMHLCHFHVESRDRAWLEDFRGALETAGVTLSMLLIDDGDIAHPDTGSRDRDWAAGWIETAAALGARSARVIAGKQKPSRSALARSAEALKLLAAQGKSQGVRVCTENWFDLTPGPDEIDYLLDRAGPDLGLLADFGNWSGPGKYADLGHILARAGDTHAKAGFGPGFTIERDDYTACVKAAIAAGYDGPFTLVYDGPDPDEWQGLAIERDVVVSSFV